MRTLALCLAGILLAACSAPCPPGIEQTGATPIWDADLVISTAQSLAPCTLSWDGEINWTTQQIFTCGNQGGCNGCYYGCDSGGCFHITVATTTPGWEPVEFVLAHELGHYVNDICFGKGSDEKAADDFANLVMHKLPILAPP